MRPDPPAPGDALELGGEQIVARRCADAKCACRQTVRFYAYRDGALVGGTHGDWAAFLHVRGHYPVDGLQLGQRLPRCAPQAPNKPPATAQERARLLPLIREGPEPPPLTQVELDQMREPGGR